MKKVLLATAVFAATALPISAANAAYGFFTLGFAIGSFSTLADCQAAGNGIVSQNIAGWVPPSYCVPLANNANPLPVVGGGFSSTPNGF